MKLLQATPLKNAGTTAQYQTFVIDPTPDDTALDFRLQLEFAAKGRTWLIGITSHGGTVAVTVTSLAEVSESLKDSGELPQLRRLLEAVH